MKPTLQPGVSLTKRVEIDRARTIGFMGEEGRVYATPMMISDIEYACRELILQHADAGEDSVGVEVSIRHLAASLPGMTATIEVKVMSIEGRKVQFEVIGRDELEPICGGTHTRFVVDVAKTLERLKAKAARRDAARRGS